MPALPYLPFYPRDWRGNSSLRRCSLAARGAWIEIMCLMHDADDYGLLRWPLREIAAAVGAPLKAVNELVEKEVLKGSDESSAAFTFRPRHGRELGPEVVLIPAGDGPCWFSSRMVKDAYVRKNRGKGTQFHTAFGEGFSAQNAAPMHAPKPPFGEGSSAPNILPNIAPIPPFGDVSGDGLSDADADTNKGSLTRTGAGGAGGFWMSAHQIMPPTPTLDAVLAVAQSRFIPPDCATAFWETHEAVGWIDARNRPIRKWEISLQRWATTWRANEGQRTASRPAFSGPASAAQQRASEQVRAMQGGVKTLADIRNEASQSPLTTENHQPQRPQE